MTAFSETLELRIVSFLDGTMSADERAAFEREMASDAALRESVELQRFIDSSIRRQFVPKTLSIPDAALREDADVVARIEPARTNLRRWIGYAVAACVLLSTAFVVNREVMRRNPDFKLVSADSLYALLQRRGWKPEQVCTTEKEFGELVESRLGQPLFPTQTPGVALVGWGYSKDYDGTPISPKTVVLLTKVDDREVMVLIDQKSRDREVTLGPANPPLNTGTLHVHRRVVGDLVLYEVTPFDTARVLPTLRQK